MSSIPLNGRVNLFSRSITDHISLDVAASVWLGTLWTSPLGAIPSMVDKELREVPYPDWDWD